MFFSRRRTSRSCSVRIVLVYSSRFGKSDDMKP
jgi:hypothetical protein